jgi:hypothetical protein
MAAFDAHMRLFALEKSSVYLMESRLRTGNPQTTLPIGPIYNPYPSGMLPSDLNSELNRVIAEVDFVEGRAFAR